MDHGTFVVHLCVLCGENCIVKKHADYWIKADFADNTFKAFSKKVKSAKSIMYQKKSV
jgi:hypothetical protein